MFLIYFTYLEWLFLAMGFHPQSRPGRRHRAPLHPIKFFAAPVQINLSLRIAA
jgi:hypothetical protein